MRRNIAGVGDEGGLQDWFRSIPLVTKALFCSTLALGALLSFGLLSPNSVVFYWPYIRDKFQIWRLFTPAIYAGPFSMNFAFHLYMLYMYSLRYESNPFNTGAGGTSADYLWMLLLGILVFILISYVFEYPIFSTQLMFMITYVWSRREPTQMISMFVLKFQALYLPWVNVAVAMVLGQDIVLPLVGIAVGHLYFFLVNVLPETHGYQLIKTPQFCIQLANYYTGMMTPAHAASATAASSQQQQQQPHPAGRGPQGAGYNWGRGNVLGAN